MTRIYSPRYAIDIDQPTGSNVYILSEPANERTIPFLFEAARFIRDRPNTTIAVVKLRNGETMDFGPCGMELGHALYNVYGFFVVNKRDQFLSTVETSKLDADGNLEITINPKNLDRGKSIPQLTDSNVIAYHLEELRIYFDIFVTRHMLPEFIPMINGNVKDARRATSVKMQERIGSMPIRFVTPDGKRVKVKTKNHPSLGSIPDLDFG